MNKKEWGLKKQTMYVAECSSNLIIDEFEYWVVTCVLSRRNLKGWLNMRDDKHMKNTLPYATVGENIARLNYVEDC